MYLYHRSIPVLTAVRPFPSVKVFCLSFREKEVLLVLLVLLVPVVSL